ncbi:MAG: hypothetical protein H7331_00980 [Bacteroidia bacterium]|nr:hypothetical protein [Bacteroidia bacterium]
MNLIKKLIVGGMSVMLITACQKQPSAEFTTDKTNYVGGDVIQLTNLSVDASKYKWTLADGQTSTSANVDYKTGEDWVNGNLTFKLVATSKNGKKSSEASKTVSIKTATGQLTIWTSKTNGAGDISVKVDGAYVGNITSYYTVGAPDCAGAGCVFPILKVGSHTISGTDGLNTWNGTITVAKNTCSFFEFQ